MNQSTPFIIHFNAGSVNGIANASYTVLISGVIVGEHILTAEEIATGNVVLSETAIDRSSDIFVDADFGYHHKWFNCCLIDNFGYAIAETMMWLPTRKNEDGCHAFRIVKLDGTYDIELM